MSGSIYMIYVGVDWADAKHRGGYPESPATTWLILCLV